MDLVLSVERGLVKSCAIRVLVLCHRIADGERAAGSSSFIVI